jgi:hypothetical protein
LAFIMIFFMLTSIPEFIIWGLRKQKASPFKAGKKSELNK